jgi:signal transduction histidine kinase
MPPSGRFTTPYGVARASKIILESLARRRLLAYRQCDVSNLTADPGESGSPVLRVRALARRHPLAADAVIAAAVLLVGVVHGFAHGDDRARVLLLTFALSLPLVWRRRSPAAVFLVLAALAFVQWLLNIGSLGDLALLIGLYTVAVHEARWKALIAAAILELGAVLAATRDGGLRGFIGLSALSVAAGVLGTSVRHRRALLASLEDRAARLELERDQQGLLAAAAERARIAREMHDIVAHNITVMIALADGAVFAAARAPEKATTAMETVSDTGRQALGEMRRLLGVLREGDGGSGLLPQPGIPEIDQLVEQVRAAGLPVTLEVAGDGRALPPGAQLTVFRLVQEALTNCLKHAGASAVAAVKLRYAADAVDVEVTDNGASRARNVDPDGRGLDGMRERAAVYAGTVEAGPRLGGGWRVHARLRLEGSVTA